MIDANHPNDAEPTDRAFNAAKQRRYLEQRSPHADFAVLASNEMWGNDWRLDRRRTAASA